MTSANTITLSPSGDSLPHEKHSLAHARTPESAVHRVVRRDLDGGQVRAGRARAAERGDAGRRDLDEVLGHAAAEEDGGGARPGRHEALHDLDEEPVVGEEVHDGPRGGGGAIALGQRAVGRGGDEQRHAVASARRRE